MILAPNIAIISHDGAQQSVADFMPQWEKLPQSSLSVYVPEGEKNGIQLGKSAYKGRDCLIRFQRVLQHAFTNSRYSNQSEWICVMEYDTVNLTDAWPKLDPRGINCGHIELCTQDKKRLGQFCALSPWIMRRPMAAALIEAIRLEVNTDFPEWTLGGLLDRVLGYIIHKHHLPVTEIKGLCPFPHAHEWSHKRMAAEGITWVHGYKNKEQFGPLWPSQT